MTEGPTPTKTRNRFVAAVFSDGSVWSLVSVSAGGVLMTWISWANPQPHGLPVAPATTTFMFLFGVALILEIRHRAEQARAAAVPVPDPRVVVPIVCRYHGAILGVHTWIAVAPISAADLRVVRVAVSMVARQGGDTTQPPDIVVHAVR